MAFLDDAEATTYHMLQHVLQNHYTTYALCLPYTLVACGALVALVYAQVDEPQGALESRVAHIPTVCHSNDSANLLLTNGVSLLHTR